MPARKANSTSKGLRATARGSGASQPIVAQQTPPVEAPLQPQTMPAMPPSLTGRAAEIWAEFAPDLIAQGLLTARDTLTFAVWCRLAEKVETGELSASIITQFRLLANDFGLTPSGKGRELGSAVPPAGSPKSKFFND